MVYCFQVDTKTKGSRTMSGYKKYDESFKKSLVNLHQGGKTQTSLCQVLRVNRSSYYKRFHQPPAARTIENQQLRQHILTVYTETKYRLGAAKIQVLLKRDYGICISAGRVYRLMKSMDLPKMATSKPTYRYQKPTVSFASPNLLKQPFQPEAPNQAMKKEELNRRIFQTLEEVELACFEYIEGFYNSKRPHGFNDMLTPNEKENYFFHASSLF